METIATLERVKINPEATQEKTAATGCCGGAPTSNAEACCKLDEEKKTEGKAGCGCGTTEAWSKKSSCC